MNNRLLLLLFFLLFTKIAKPQENNIYKMQQLIGEGYVDPSFINKGVHFKEGFLPGKIVLNSGDSLLNLQLRYNCYIDQIIWLSKNNGQIKLDKPIVNKFELQEGSSLYSFIQTRLAEVDSTSQFYQVCYKGKVMLLVKRNVKPSSGYINGSTHYQNFKPAPLPFLVVNNKTFRITRFSFKAIYQLFPQLKNDIQQRIKEMNLRDKTESDFIHFITEIEDILLKAN